MSKTLTSFDTGFRKITKALEKLYDILQEKDKHGFTSDQYVDAYSTVYNMCTQKVPHDFSEELYKKYGEVFDTYCICQVNPVLVALHDEALLIELGKRWDSHQLMIRWMKKFFEYLDRYYTKRNQKPMLQNIGLQSFKDKVYEELKGRVKDAVLRMIQAERGGEAIDRPLLRNVVSIFSGVAEGMDTYTNDLERFVLDDTGAYYKAKASEWIESDSCPEFIVKAEECLKREEERVGAYLHKESKPKLLGRVEEELLVRYEDQLLTKENSGVQALLRDDKREDLTRLFRLYSRVPSGLKPISDIFRKHVEEEGLALVKQILSSIEKKESKKEEGAIASDATGGNSPEMIFVKSVIELHDKYMGYVEGPFASNNLFHKALKEAFETFCNKKLAIEGATTETAQVPELFAAFCDTLLKKGSGDKLSDDQIEESLDKVVKLINYLSDKDLFSSFYQKKLSRRLLADKGTSDEIEKNVLTKLKQAHGPQYTSKMEGMLNDLQLAKDQTVQFSKYKERNEISLPTDLSVTLLTTGFWPSMKPMELNLPSDMMACVESFMTFYNASAKQRKLLWIYGQGQCQVKATFGGKAYDLMMSPVQAVVLSLFNEEERLTAAQVHDKVGKDVPVETLNRVLFSFISKYKILTKEPVSKKVEPTDSFSVNQAFSDKMRRIKIPMPLIEDRRKVREDVESDRKHVVQAAIVRIMKSRKIFAHQELVVEVAKQISMFKADIRQIKKEIEGLIEREFIERDETNNAILKYMA